MIGQLVGAGSSSDSEGMGLVLPMVLAVTVLAAVLYFVIRRPRADNPGWRCLREDASVDDVRDPGDRPCGVGSGRE